MTDKFTCFHIQCSRLSEMCHLRMTEEMYVTDTSTPSRYLANIRSGDS